jgi:hypothetical protein
MSKILGSVWFSPRSSILDIRCIGIVAFESHAPTGQWKVYIGYGQGVDEDLDAEEIVRTGVPLGSKEAAIGFFPHLAEDKFSY